MKLTEQDKRRIIAFDVGGWDEYEIAVDFLWRKYPIEYAPYKKQSKYAWRKRRVKIEDKIYRSGLATLDELILHRNISKEVILTIGDASILSDMVVHVNPHTIFTFSEREIRDFYQALMEYDGSMK